MQPLKACSSIDTDNTPKGARNGFLRLSSSEMTISKLFPHNLSFPHPESTQVLDLREFKIGERSGEKLLSTLKAIYSRISPEQNPLLGLHLPNYFNCSNQFLTSLSEICPQLREVSVKGQVTVPSGLPSWGLARYTHPKIHQTICLELMYSIHSTRELIDMQNRYLSYNMQNDTLYGLHIAIESRESLEEFLQFFVNPPKFYKNDTEIEPVWVQGSIAMLTLKVPDLKQWELDLLLRQNVRGLTIAQSNVTQIHSLSLNTLVCEGLDHLGSIYIPHATGRLDVSSSWQLETVVAPKIRKLKLHQCNNWTSLDAAQARFVEVKDCARIACLSFEGTVNALALENCSGLVRIHAPKAINVKIYRNQNLLKALFPEATKVVLFDCPSMRKARLLKVDEIDIRKCPSLNILDAPKARWESENSQMNQLFELTDLNIPSFVGPVCVNGFFQLRILDASKSPKIFAERTPPFMRIHGPARDYAFMSLCAAVDFAGAGVVLAAVGMLYRMVLSNSLLFVAKLILVPAISLFAIFMGSFIYNGSRDVRHAHRQLIR